MNKIKVMMVNEYSWASTGYGRYANSVLARLHDDPRFEVYEFATQYNPHHDSKDGVPWTVIPNIPHDITLEKYFSEWIKNPHNNFGGTLFEKVLLKVQPHVVFTITDHWMQKFINDSPYRKCFKYIWMPPCDAEPQNIEWIEDMASCDAVLTYTDWAKEVIEKQSPRVKVYKPAPPAAEPCFAPMDKKEVKKQLGFDPECKIIGTVMRNQRRKLFPNLFESFRKYLDKTGREDVYLYCHTSYPDGSWRIPELLQQFDIGHKTYFTYICQKCLFSFPSLYADRATCIQCGKIAATPCNTVFGVDQETLAIVYNCFDLYVQYSNCLAKGQQVILKDGYKNIEDVKIGDLALTHEGRYRKVLNTFEKTHNSQMYEVSFWGDPEKLILTGEHPIYGYTDKEHRTGNKKCSFREWLGVNPSRKELKPKFIKAEEFSKGDLVCFPIQTDVQDVDIIDIVDNSDVDGYIINNLTYRHKNSSLEHTRKLVIDNECCKFIGLFVADGNINRQKSGNCSIRITSHLLDKLNIELAENFLSKHGNVKTNFYSDRKAVSHDMSNALLGKLFDKWCYEDKSKRLPAWTENLPLEKLRNILHGLCMGDGHACVDRNVTMYCTTSNILYKQIKNICYRLGMNFNVRKVQKSGNRKPQYQFEFAGNWKHGIPEVKNTNCTSFITKEYFCRKIKEIKPVDYVGSVYNIEVEEDNSYVTGCTVTHNSEGFGMSAPEAAACGVPVMEVDYSAMSDVVRKLGGYPIKVLGLQSELETGCFRAFPDNNHLVELLTKFFNKPEGVRLIERKKTYDNYHTHYGWDKAAEVWKEIIIQISDGTSYWDIPIDHFNPAPPNVHAEMTDSEYSKWLLTNVAGQPWKIGTFMDMQITRDLSYGESTGSFTKQCYHSDDTLFNESKVHPFNRETAYQVAYNIGCNLRDKELLREQTMKAGK